MMMMMIKPFSSAAKDNFFSPLPSIIKSWLETILTGAGPALIFSTSQLFCRNSLSPSQKTKAMVSLQYPNTHSHWDLDKTHSANPVPAVHLMSIAASELAPSSLVLVSRHSCLWSVHANSKKNWLPLSLSLCKYPVRCFLGGTALNLSVSGATGHLSWTRTKFGLDMKCGNNMSQAFGGRIVALIFRGKESGRSLVCIVLISGPFLPWHCRHVWIITI